MNIFAILGLLVFLVNALPPLCNSSSQCNAVTQRPDYVECSVITGRCACLSSLGFSGNATLGNKCRCESPSNIYRSPSNVTYCYRTEDAITYRIEKARGDRQLWMIQTLYESLVFERASAIIMALITGQPSIVSEFFVPEARGRVNPLGTYSGITGLLEYYYGLTSSGAARVPRVIFKKLITQGNIVHVDVTIEINLYDQTQQQIVFSYNLTQTGSYTFNDAIKIVSTDLTIPNLGAISNQQSLRTPEFINQICFIILNVAHCNASNDPTGHYTDFGDCVQSFNAYEWGTWDNLYFSGNSARCRLFHALIAIMRPDAHCSHAGKTGGGKCIDHDYASYYLTDY